MVFYGSGLVAEPNLPARYFYGELKDYWGNRIDIRDHYVMCATMRCKEVRSPLH